MKDKHPGFKKVSQKIQKEQGVSKNKQMLYLRHQVEELVLLLNVKILDLKE